MKSLGIAFLSTLLLAGVVGAASVPHPHANPRAVAPRVASFDTVSVTWLNAKIAAAATAREPWVRDPVAIGLHDANLSPEAVAERTDFSLTWKGNSGENPDAGDLVLVDLNVKDDSIGATWDLYRMAREADGSWRVVEHRIARRCDRGTLAQTSTFHKGSCL